MQRAMIAVLFCFAVCGGAFAAEVSGSAFITGRKCAAHDVVVYLEGAKKAAPLPKAVVDQRNQTFMPHVSVVTVGTTVEFPNNDTIFHNVFAYFHAKKFDLGMYPRGSTKRQTFDKKGVVALLCNVHSEMSAYIMVVDTPYYAVTDKSGKFQIKDVEPGSYTLHAWHESGAAYTQNITVKSGDLSLKLNLARK
jgi:plastocyanin